jgi:hypothetical protein
MTRADPGPGHQSQRQGDSLRWLTARRRRGINRSVIHALDRAVAAPVSSVAIAHDALGRRRGDERMGDVAPGDQCSGRVTRG